MDFFGRRPLLAAIIGALFIAFSAIFVRLAGVAPATAAVFRCAYALPVLGVLAGMERRRFGRRPRSARMAALLAGSFFAGDLLFWHYSIGAVGAGLATVLANTQVLFVALAAWAFLDERPHAAAFVAIPIVLGGVVLISGVVGADPYGADPLAGTIFGVATGIAYTGFLLVLRRGNEDIRRPAGPLFDATLTAALLSVLAGLVLRDVELMPSWPAHGWLVSLALSSQVAGWLLISVSLPRLPAVMTSLVLTLQPVGSVIFAMVLLAEAPSAFQLVGVIVIVAGIVIARLGRPEPVREPVEAPPLQPEEA